ncbi:hypothetical protein SAY86_012796 [Trapa natans]|uniref:Protein kinase domain-containing protein n=1 Tax=Trapa natans TaxID=22666 RepID=A0AAN7LYH8_TRANT|nr:hypothetical protein SAY86_012796 [Trapa natans]
MGCLCSKESKTDEKFEEEPTLKEEADQSKTVVQLVAPSSGEDIDLELVRGGGKDGSSRHIQRVASQANAGSVHNPSSHKSGRAERPSSASHQKGETADTEARHHHEFLVSLPNCIEGEETAAGWPSWLTSVAAEAVHGIVPRRAESFKKLKMIGRGTYSRVYKGQDLETGKTVAMKKVRFSNMDPESVRFMAREIHILRKLDHPNIIQLEGLVISRVSGSLYLIFEYMDHDLAGILARPDVELREPQIKCYMQQLLRGLEHCQSRGILHRDIKGSNLLVGGDGVLKIGDWGLANFCHQEPLTSRVVTLWYRAPELLLGDTKYGVGVDLWSAGCILAELYAGEPILPGRTEVEQLHQILKLCGSPTEEYWKKLKWPHATSFKPQVQYKCCVAEKFKDVPSAALSLIEKLLSLEPRDRGSAANALKSDFFTTKPLPCDPSSLPKLPPSKEFDAKLRDDKAKQRKAGSVKARGTESGRRDVKAVPTLECNAHGEVSLQSNPKSVSYKLNHLEDSGSGFPIRPSTGARPDGFTHSSSTLHPSSAWTSKTNNSTGRGSTNDAPSTGYIPKKNRIHYSGPLTPPGGNLEDMLKEHERHIQQAVRNARLDRNRTIKGERGVLGLGGLSRSRPNKRFHFIKPCSSLKQSRKKQQQQTLQKTTAPRSLKWFSTPKEDEGDGGDGSDEPKNEDDSGGLEGDTAVKGTLLAGVLLIGVVGGFASVGYIYRDQINAFLNQLSTFIDGYGPAGYAVFVAVYTGLEILAIPAIPLTMSAGLLFGSLIGTVIVSISGTLAASVAFLIARYFARERILKLVEGNKKFLAIDKAIGENGFRVVTLLRLSPLLPFSLSNYLYGLTSVKFFPYVLGSWLGMLPGSWAYVSAGAFGRAIIQDESEIGSLGGNGQLLTLGLGLLATAVAATYVTRLAKDAVKDIE